MKHHGNICKINGAEVESVDVIIGGSPCQDLSVAGKRAGLDGERSGLFMEQIRIIKEMRDADKLRHTNAVSADCGEGGTTTIESGITQHGLCGAGQLVRPRYMVWENVPGAFSSNKGEDFRIVLEETAKIADEAAVIPRPNKGKWANAGAVMGDGWSIAWRVFDAQFWGVPQRRRRIALVADFGGQSAPEILFERKGMSWDSAESGTKGEGVAGSVESGVGTTEYLTGWDNQEKRIFSDRGVSPTLSGSDGGGGRTVCGYVMPINTQVITRHNALGNGTGFGLGKDGDPAYTIQAGHEHGVAVFSFDSLSSNSMKSSNPHSGCRQVEIAKCIDTTNPDQSKNQGGMAVVHGLVSKGNGEAFLMPETHMSLSTGGGQAGQGYPAVFDARGNGDGSIAPTMTGDHQSRVTDYTGIIAAVDCRNGTENPDINGTLQAKSTGGMSLNLQNTVRQYQAVRRLTPLECERLQGFPDSWTDIPPQAQVTAEDLSFWRTVWDEWQAMNGKKPKTDKQIIKWLQSEPADSARYKALGNSIALPPWKYVLSRIKAQGAHTMASLFDGIGGFPKVWNDLGGNTLWSSEIEPFPIAVTRYRFRKEAP